MRILILLAFLAAAGTANATSSKAIMSLSNNDKILTVKEDGSIQVSPFFKLTKDSVVLERSDCITFNGNTNNFEQTACLVKKELKELSVTSEIAVD